MRPAALAALAAVAAARTRARSPPAHGDDLCPCIDAHIVLAKFRFPANPAVANCPHQFGASADNCLPWHWSDASHRPVAADEFDPVYGGSCQKWDTQSGPCFDQESKLPREDAPVWCKRAWCYVDVANCAGQATSGSVSSMFFPGQPLHYNYATCNVPAKEMKTAGPIDAAVRAALGEPMDPISPVVALPPPLPPLEPEGPPVVAPAPGAPPEPCSGTMPCIEEAVVRALGAPADPLPPLNVTPAGVKPAPDLAWRCVHARDSLTPAEKYDCDAVARGDLTRAQVTALRSFNASAYNDETLERVVNELSFPDRLHYLRGAPTA
jgi:hypothetical protein